MDKQVRRRFTTDFKIQAIALAESLGKAAAARKLGISARSLENWVNVERQGRAKPSRRQEPSEMQAELDRLRTENSTLKMEREILKKAAVFFAKESK